MQQQSFRIGCVTFVVAAFETFLFLSLLLVHSCPLSQIRQSWLAYALIIQMCVGPVTKKDDVETRAPPALSH